MNNFLSIKYIKIYDQKIYYKIFKLFFIVNNFLDFFVNCLERKILEEKNLFFIEIISDGITFSLLIMIIMTYIKIASQIIFSNFF